MRDSAFSATIRTPVQGNGPHAMRLTAWRRARRVEPSSQQGDVACSSGAFPGGGSLAFLSSRSRPARPASRSGPVMAIGQRVFVDSAGSRSGSVALADVSGKIPSAVNLADGSEVEVVAWRPRGANETRYRVRAPHGVDGWLPAENLRRALLPVVPLEPSTVARATTAEDTGGRRFGQRSHPESRPSSVEDTSGRRFGQRSYPESRPSSPASLTPGQLPPTVVDTGGRRFGQH